jgi:uncharacterized membrane protein
MPPPGAPGQWSPSEAIGFGWNAVTKDFAGTVLPFFLASLVTGIPIGIFYVILIIVNSVLGGSIDYNILAIINYVLIGLVVIVAIAAVSYTLGGTTKFALKIARGEKPPLGEVFSGGAYMGKIFVTLLLFMIVLVIGEILCVIPMFILQFGLMFWMHTVVDRELSGVDALKSTWELTNGHKVTIFVYWLLQVLVILAGELACGIGIFVALPIIQIANAYIYLKLRGEEPRLPA